MDERWIRESVQADIEVYLRRIKLGVYDEQLDGTLEEILEEIWGALN